MEEKYKNFDFNFMPIGQAIKKARELNKITREQLAEQLDISPRHLASIENEGQYPSFQLFVQLVTIFGISVDSFLFSDKQDKKTPLRRQIDIILDNLDDKELAILEGTARTIYKVRQLKD